MLELTDSFDLPFLFDFDTWYYEFIIRFFTVFEREDGFFISNMVAFLLLSFLSLEGYTFSW